MPALIRRDRRVAVAAFVAANAVFIALVASIRAAGQDARVVVDVGWVLSAVWAFAEWCISLKRETEARKANTWFAASAASYLLAVIIWAIIDLSGDPNPYPSLADVFYLLTPLCMVAGLFCLHPRDIVHGYRRLQTANLALVAAAATILASFTIAPLLAHSRDGLIYIGMTVAYWAVYATAAAFTVIAVLGFRWREAARLIAYLGAAMVTFVVAAIPYAYDLIDHYYVAGTWYDILWFTAPCLLALAGREFRPQARAAVIHDVHAASKAVRITSSLLMAGTVLALGVNQAKTMGGVPGVFLVAAAAVIAFALTLRERALRLIEARLETRVDDALADSRENEARSRDFAAASSDFFLETDENLIVRKVIAGAPGMLAVAPDQLLGRPVFPAKEDPRIQRIPTAQETLAVMARREVCKRFEYKVPLPNGEFAWRRCGGVPFFNTAGEFKGYRISCQDITAEKRLEATTLEQAAERARIIDNMLGAFYRASTLAGDAAVVEYISPRITSILGYTPDELIGPAAPNLAPPGAEPLTLGQIATQGEWVARSERKLRLRRKDGGIVAVLEKTAMVEPRPDGRIVFEGLIVNITDLEEREASLEEGRRRLEIATDHIQGWIYSFRVSEDGSIPAFYRTSGFERVTGYTNAELQRGEDYIALLHPDDRAALPAMINGEPDPERFREATYRITVKSGAQRWIRERMRVTLTAEGHKFVEGLSLDVTDKIEQEHAQQRRAQLTAAAARLIGGKNVLAADRLELFQAITEEAAEAADVERVGVWLFDDANQQSITSIDIFDRRTGKHDAGLVRNREQFPGHFEFVDKANPVVVDLTARDVAPGDAARRVLEGVQITSAMYSPIFRDGVIVGAASLARSDASRPWTADEIAFAASLSDSIALILEAAERRAAEAKATATTAELQRVVRALDSALEQIFILDADDRVIYINESTNKIRGSAGQFDAIGRPFKEVFPAFAAQRAEQMEQIKAQVSRTGAWSGEIVLTRDGMEIVFETNVAASRDGGMIFAATNVTERKHHERKAQELRHRLAEAEKMEAIGKLAGGIAHDFNNLIAAIRSFAGLIVYDLDEAHPDRMYAERIVATSERAAELVRQILLYARAGVGEKRSISLSGSLEELKQMLSSSVPRNVVLDVTSPRRECIIKGNAGQILQVLMNLAVNAADALSDGGGEIQVSVEPIVLSQEEAARLAPGTENLARGGEDEVVVCRHVTGSLLAQQHYACITVRDNGPGMPLEVVKRAFEPFFTTKDKAKGTGLGLAVVKSIVAAHDGAIVVTSGPEYGTRFQVYLPESNEPIEVSAPVKDMASFRGCERILVVDDEVDVADALSMALQKFGYETAPVYGSTEALEIFAEDPMAWDVVVTDQMMPQMKGVQLARKLKRLHAGVEVVLCTGYSDTLTEQKAKLAGASAFLYKPAAPELIAQTIRQALARKAASPGSRS